MSHDANAGDRQSGASDDREHAELYGTYEQQLIFLNMHWGAWYSFAPPQAPGGQWTATARFGAHDGMKAFGTAELVEEVRAHYRGHQPQGSPGEESLCWRPGVLS
jgi:hypothetical protein